VPPLCPRQIKSGGWARAPLCPMVSAPMIWTSLSGTSVPTSEAKHIQKAWDMPVAVNHIDQLLSRTSNEVDKARLLAATATHDKYRTVSALGPICLSAEMSWIGTDVCWVWERTVLGSKCPHADKSFRSGCVVCAVSVN